jgi:uncharacterized protein YprB with RNaseH-like and TPR domain
MIKNTFCILNGIGEKLERRLWRNGILTWKEFTDADSLQGFSSEKKRLFDKSLFDFTAHLNAGNAQYFDRNIRRREHWRLFESFRDYAVCLDIETNGLQPHSGGFVTVIGLYDGFDYKCLVRGKNLTTENLSKELQRYKCLITFYGSAFDIPFLLRTFRDLTINIPHFDLCFAAKKLKMQGGLKRIEADLGIERDESVQGLNGYDAVRLWELAKRGSNDARELLITYNREDTVNLMGLATIFYSRLRQSTGIEEYLSCGAA